MKIFYFYICFIIDCSRTKIPLKIVAPFLLLFVNFTAIANPCKNSFKEDPFLVFVRNQNGNDWRQKMPHQWEFLITKNTSQWTKEDKEGFLQLLTTRLGVQHTLDIIKESSILKNLDYNDLINKISFYDSYTGETEIITNHLKKPLKHFEHGRIEEIVQTVRFLEVRITKQMVINILRKDIYKIANMNVLDLRYLEKHLYGREKMKQILINRFIDLPVVQLKDIKKTLEFVKKYLSNELISEVTNKDPLWIFRIYFDDSIQKKINDIESHFGKNHIKRLIKLIIARTSEIYINSEDQVIDTYTVKELAEFTPEYFNDNIHKAINKLSNQKDISSVFKSKKIIYECIHDFFRWQLNQFLHTGDYIEEYFISNTHVTNTHVTNTNTVKTLKTALRELKIWAAKEDLQDQ